MCDNFGFSPSEIIGRYNTKNCVLNGEVQPSREAQIYKNASSAETLSIFSQVSLDFPYLKKEKTKRIVAEDELWPTWKRAWLKPTHCMEIESEQTSASNKLEVKAKTMYHVNLDCHSKILVQLNYKQEIKFSKDAAAIKAVQTFKINDKKAWDEESLKIGGDPVPLTSWDYACELERAK